SSSLKGWIIASIFFMSLSCHPGHFAIQISQRRDLPVSAQFLSHCPLRTCGRPNGTFLWAGLEFFMVLRSEPGGFVLDRTDIKIHLSDFGRIIRASLNE